MSRQHPSQQGHEPSHIYDALDTFTTNHGEPENLLQRNPDVNAVYTINEPAARGAYAALEAQNLTDQVVIGSIDGGCQGVQDVADGKYAATVMQFPAEMVRQGMDAIITAANGGDMPTGFVDTGSVVITDNPVEGIESESTEWGLENCWG